MPVTLDFSTLDLMDALDLAILIEVEAFERYKYFSEQLGYRSPGDAASIFRSMAENESKHGQQLNERREELFGDKPLRVSKDSLFDVEAPEVGAPRSNQAVVRATSSAGDPTTTGFAGRTLWKSRP